MKAAGINTTRIVTTRATTAIITDMLTRTTTTTELSAAALYRLTTWLSPAYPVGGFAYSGGIEWAVEAGDITSPETLRGWLETMLGHGAGYNDAILFAQAHLAAANADDGALADIVELAAALVPTRERQLETATLGRAFVDVTCAAWPCDALTRLQQTSGSPIVYPIAVGVACAGHDIPLEPALHAFLAALTSSWISAAVRLVPLGHTDSQHTLRAIEPAVARATQRTLAATLDDLGSATFRAEIASARHETQYTRLFRS
jgi:urease accessory protein